MSDQYDKEAMELTPCYWAPAGFAPCSDDGYPVKCNMCNHRPAIAARLRRDGEEIDWLKAEAADREVLIQNQTTAIAKLCTSVDDRREESGRLVTELQDTTWQEHADYWQKEYAVLKGQVGHLKTDSDGACGFIKRRKLYR